MHLERVVQPRSRSSTAARTARSAVSCTTGIPKTPARVADELLDRAAVTLEHLARGLVVARPDAPERLRVELLAERRRVRDVAEDEGDRLPDHQASLGRFGRA